MSSRPLSPEAFVNELVRIDRLIAEGQLQAAAEALNAVQRSDPGDPRPLLVGMRLARAANNPAGELQAARRAVALSPQWPVSVTELGFALSRQGQHAEAMEQARKAVSLAPQEVEVVSRAVGIANDAAEHEQALEWVRAALALVPPDRLGLPGAQILRYEQAHQLTRLEQHEQALPLFTALLEEIPDSPAARQGALECARALGDAELERRHADALLALAPDHPHYQYQHAVAYGETPQTQPDSVVAELFDQHAKDFDMLLVRGLKYRLPELVAQRLLELHPDRRFNLLDLGCGTGLLAVFLGPIEGHIIGVDLSEKMLEQAARTRLYSRLHQVNILDALRETPADLYEVIACNDVLVYVGELTQVIPNAWRVLKPGGHFIFSCESAGEDEADLVLRGSSGRYAHKRSHVERLCREAGFEDIEVEQLEQLRLEGGQPLPGYLVVARKPAQPTPLAA
jgi:predicted TPR repeat methyltransferase